MNQKSHMSHDHSHAHNHTFSWKHLKEHPICLATLVYNICVVLVELVILSMVTDMDFHDLVGYEGVLQLVHIVGIIVLAIVNYVWIHRVSTDHDTTIQSTKKFFNISVVIFVLHIFLLHIIPRAIGFELHHHDETHEHGMNSELIEFITLAGIIVFVTFAFRYQELILNKLHLKNKYTILLSKKKHLHHYHSPHSDLKK